MFSPRAGLWAVLLSLACGPTLASARDVTAGDLEIRRPWARATPGGAQVAGGYVTIVNHGATADTLTGGSLEAAAASDIHDMTNENGVMKMRSTGPLAIPPGGTLVLAPAGRHIMFSGLKHGLKQGDDIDGTLVFTRAGTVPVQFDIESIAAKGPADESGPATPATTTK